MTRGSIDAAEREVPRLLNMNSDVTAAADVRFGSGAGVFRSPAPDRRA